MRIIVIPARSLPEDARQRQSAVCILLRAVTVHRRRREVKNIGQGQAGGFDRQCSSRLCAAKNLSP